MFAASLRRGGSDLGELTTAEVSKTVLGEVASRSRRCHRSGQRLVLGAGQQLGDLAGDFPAGLLAEGPDAPDL
jgi:hypothetical protein